LLLPLYPNCVGSMYWLGLEISLSIVNSFSSLVGTSSFARKCKETSSCVRLALCYLCFCILFPGANCPPGVGSSLGLSLVASLELSFLSLCSCWSFLRCIILSSSMSQYHYSYSHWRLESQRRGRYPGPISPRLSRLSCGSWLASAAAS